MTPLILDGRTPTSLAMETPSEILEAGVYAVWSAQNAAVLAVKPYEIPPEEPEEPEEGEEGEEPVDPVPTVGLPIGSEPTHIRIGTSVGSWVMISNRAISYMKVD
jgi:hypothetical protein